MFRFSRATACLPILPAVIAFGLMLAASSAQAAQVDDFCYGGERVCEGAEKWKALYQKRFADALAGFGKRMEGFRPADRRTGVIGMLMAQEASVLQVIGWTKEDVMARVRTVRKAMASAVLRNPGVSDDQRVWIYNRVMEVPVRFPSEANEIGRNLALRTCNLFGQNAFSVVPAPPQAYEMFSNWHWAQSAAFPREVVLCPGWFLNEFARPGARSSMLDFVLAHEIGHQISTSYLGPVIDFYQPLQACIEDVVGLGLSRAQMDETIGDYWAAETLAILYKDLSPQAAREAARRGMGIFCGGNEAFDLGPEDWANAHLPAPARQELAILRNPRLRALIGCPVSNEDFYATACDLTGLVTKP